MIESLILINKNYSWPKIEAYERVYYVHNLRFVFSFPYLKISFSLEYLL
jgi:hypothetical protein